MYDSERMAQIRAAVEPAGIPVLPGVMPLVSYRNALFMHHEVPGVHLPASILARMEKYPQGPDAEREGFDIAVEMIDVALRSGAPGIYIVTPFQRADLTARLIEYVRRAT